MKNFENLLAHRTVNMGTNAIREILKVVSLPGMVSLAGGIPAPESFPMEIIEELSGKVFRKYSSGALQYDLTEGFGPLREALSLFLAKGGIEASADEILISSGSQGVLDALGKVMITKGDRIAVEAPTYIGALQAFTPYEPEYLQIETDTAGVIPESLEALLSKEQVKFIYLVPTFQNPTGRTLPLERRIRIAEIIKRYDALLIEDDPYSALRYRGEAVPSIKSLAPDHVVYVSTLSKVFAPGLRIGFSVAPPAVGKWLVMVKQGTDLHTSTLNQALAAEYLSGGYLDEHLPSILGIYKPRQEAMLSALEKYFPDSVNWSRPEGGMFIWVEGPSGLDMIRVYDAAVKRGTAFVPGRYFYSKEGDGLETMRLNYTMSDEAVIEAAVRTLGGVLEEEIERQIPR